MSGLICTDVSVQIGGRQILSGVSLACAAGTITALLGPNGAGKSTLLRAAAGLLACKGRISAGGNDLPGMSRASRARAIGYLPQDHQIHWPLSVRDIVALGRYPHGLSDPARLSGADAAAVSAAMAACEITELAGKVATRLSGGERARVALARVLATQSPLLLADEPTASLDPHHQLAVMDLLRARARAGATVVAITHDLDLARAFADRVVVLDRGRLVAEGPPAHALSPGLMADVFRLRQTADGSWSRI